jgi:hypothetical protein
MSLADAPAAEARAVLELNRQQLRALVEASSAAANTRRVPRSATFRWLSSRLNAGEVVTGVVTALIFRRTFWRQLLAGFLQRIA